MCPIWTQNLEFQFLQSLHTNISIFRAYLQCPSLSISESGISGLSEELEEQLFQSFKLLLLQFFKRFTSNISLLLTAVHASGRYIGEALTQKMVAAAFPPNCSGFNSKKIPAETSTELSGRHCYSWR